jgi:hypothetical protein
MTQKKALTALPPPGTTRWVARRKAAVVAAVSGGQITLEEACRRYELSEEEFLSWQRAFETDGIGGLRATRLRYRGNRSSRLAQNRIDGCDCHAATGEGPGGARIAGIV